MMHPDCRHFMDSWDAFRDHRLTEPEHAVVVQHLATCPECAVRYKSIEGTAAHLREVEMDPFTRRRIAVAAAGFRKSRRDASRPIRKGVRSLAWGLGLAALGFLWVLAGVAKSPSPLLPPAPKVLRPATAPDRPSGMTPGCTLSASGMREIVLFPGTSLYPSADAELEATRITDSDVRFALLRGSVLVEIGAHDPDFRFVIATPRGEAEARGTVFAVTVFEDGAETARVDEGKVEIRGKGTTDGVVLNAGEAAEVRQDNVRVRALTDAERREDTCRLRGGDDCHSLETPRVALRSAPNEARPASPEPVRATVRMAAALDKGRLMEASKIAAAPDFEKSDRISTVKLLARLARAYRSAKMFREAKNVYVRLINAYPGSETAADSLVALGQIEYRTLGLPADALTHFARYLEEHPEGFLAETARAERIRVLSSQGRYKEVIAAANDYAARHSADIGLAEVTRLRGDALSKTGRCAEALDAYRRVIEKWPGTLEAKRAEKGASSCD